MKFLFILFLSVHGLAHAYELIVIQAVSDSKTTFVTRNGKRQGIQPGATGTFTADNISLLARAIHVTGSHTQWEIMNENARVPFAKGAIVTYYPAEEYLWALSVESERKKYIKNMTPEPKSSLIFKGAVTRGLSKTVSDAPSQTEKRGGYLGELIYERDIAHNFAFDVGYRYEREVINYSGATLITKRNLLIGDIIYYFDGLKEYISGRLYLAAGVGYGLSDTSSIGVSQSGPVGLLPAVKIGASLPFNEEWEFLIDGAFESLSSREKQENGEVQSATQTNFKVGFGLRRFL